MAKKKSSVKKKAVKKPNHKKVNKSKSSKKTNEQQKSQGSSFKQQIKSSFKFLKDGQQAFLKIMFFNAVFLAVLYYELLLSNQWMGSVIPFVQQSAQTSLFGVLGLIIAMLFTSVIVPVVLYALFRAMITATILNKSFQLKDLVKQSMAYIVAAIMIGSLSMVYILFLGMMRKEVIPLIILITGLPLIIILYAWCQSLALNINKNEIFKKSQQQLRPMMKLSLHVLGMAVLAYIAVGVIFYLGGSLWVSTLQTPESAWNYVTQYTLLFKGAAALVTIILISLGQVHCAVNAKQQ